MKKPPKSNLRNTPLLKALTSEANLQRYRFHVPCHAGQNLAGMALGDTKDLFTFDLTELPPLDVLGNPQGVLRESQEAAASLFGASYTYYLINGASVGIMAAMLATGIRKGSQVLVARNCHRSVLHGLILSGAQPHWLLPDTLLNWGLWGAVNPEILAQQLEELPQIELFVMTHPSYEGIGSDITPIADVCRRHGVKLIVDEAHGSLWPLFDFLPVSAIQAGADAVIHSLHKSGGSLTQTALLHLPKDSSLAPEVVQQALNLLQTTSPSYPLLANVEATCAFLGSPEGQEQARQRFKESQVLKDWVNTSLTTIQALEKAPGFQLFLKSSKLTGEAFGELLEETYGIAYEAVTSHGVLLLMNLGLPDSALEALGSALSRIDLDSQGEADTCYSEASFTLPEAVLTPQEAFYTPGCTIPKAESIGRIAKQIVATCPPGIPVLMPGERITHHHLPLLPEQLLVTLA